jgi:hypothetical protein
MKPVSRCKGCGRRKLLNHLELCKRCNRESDKHVTKEDLARLLRERDFVRAAKLKQKKAAADKEAEEKEVADEKEKAEKEEAEKKEASKDARVKK